MKVFSVDNGDRGRVWLDGIERTHVVECSEEGRYIIRCRTDEAGNTMLDDSGEAVLRERLEGLVVFEAG